MLAEVERTWLVVELRPEGPLELGRGCTFKNVFEGIGVKDNGIVKEYNSCPQYSHV